MSRLLIIGTALAGLTVGCSGSNSTTSSSGTGTSTDSSSGGTTGGTAGARNNTLSGTFTAPGISATFVGAVQGTYANSTAVNPTNATTWTALSGFADPTAQFPVVTVTTPVGGSGQIQMSVVVSGPPAAGVHTCGDPSGIVLLYLPNGSIGATYGNFVDGGCTVTIETPTLVTSATLGDGSKVGTYFAHGAVTATLLSHLQDGGANNTGTLSATW